jgi:hypothetical protein
VLQSHIASRHASPQSTRQAMSPSRPPPAAAPLSTRHLQHRLFSALPRAHIFASLFVSRALPDVNSRPLASTSTDASAGTSAAIRTSALLGEKFRERNEICSAVKAPSSPSYITSTHPHHRLFIHFLVVSISQSNARHPHSQCCPQDYHGL